MSTSLFLYWAPMSEWVSAKWLQSCLTLWDSMDCSPPGSSVHRILQARILEWVVIPSSKGDLPNPGIEPTSLMSPAQADKFLTTSTTWETLRPPMLETKYLPFRIGWGSPFPEKSPRQPSALSPAMTSRWCFYDFPQPSRLTTCIIAQIWLPASSVRLRVPMGRAVFAGLGVPGGSLPPQSDWVHIREGCACWIGCSWGLAHSLAKQVTVLMSMVMTH